ncbi:dipeptide ABC transporter permease DppB [Kangiella profundi]|uniref:Dipeptide ABC transporter permease DppB n=1 Tax=Kangiella profundi TaxID=1561924 RepID=A0A2K9A9I8_9GAMM|nr:ABC transporter permease subunit [Kangiella profundi]AUD79390.1 dipeptide ABC transporter permease DppB [Kangiella profundi]GGE98928.1 peptide ABC transporter permease [Kangiella profundi]
MLKLLIRHGTTLLISLFGLTLLTFVLSQRGDSALHIYQSQHFMGQYLEYLEYLLAGDWGYSSIHNRPVLYDFLQHFPATIELVMLALLFAIIFGLTLGIMAANRRGKWLDNTLMGVTLAGYSMPIYWWGMLLVLLFSLTLGWTPVAGRIDYIYDVPPVTRFMLIDSLLSQDQYGFDAFFNALLHLILPAITLSTIPMAIIARMTRSSLLGVLKAEYIRTARSKGLSQQRIIWVHALRNALIPILTISGVQVSIIMSGVIITEYIFAWPGVGKWLLEAVSRRDFASIQAGILALSLLVIAFNLALDLLASYMNPRLRRPS